MSVLVKITCSTFSNCHNTLRIAALKWYFLVIPQHSTIGHNLGLKDGVLGAVGSLPRECHSDLSLWREAPGVVHYSVALLRRVGL